MTENEKKTAEAHLLDFLMRSENHSGNWSQLEWLAGNVIKNMTQTEFLTLLLSLLDLRLITYESYMGKVTVTLTTNGWLKITRAIEVAEDK